MAFLLGKAIGVGGKPTHGIGIIRRWRTQIFTGNIACIFITHAINHGWVGL